MAMNFPLEPTGAFSAGVGLLMSFIIGFGFGFFLEKAGFGSARKLTAQFYLKDFASSKSCSPLSSWQDSVSGYWSGWVCWT